METTHPVHPQEAATALTDDQLTTAHTEAMRRLHAAQDDARAWTLAAIARIVRQHFPTAHSVQVTNIPGETAGLDALLDAGDQVLALWDWEQPDECFADTTAFEEVDQLCAQLVYFDNPEDGGAYTLPAPLALVTERLADALRREFPTAARVVITHSATLGYGLNAVLDAQDELLAAGDALRRPELAYAERHAREYAQLVQLDEESTLVALPEVTR